MHYQEDESWRLPEEKVDMSAFMDVPNKLDKHHKFIRGPIPLTWAMTACHQSSAACRISFMIWYQKGVTRSETFRVSHTLAKQFGISRYAAYHGLVALEQAGLITVTRKPGKAAEVTVIIAGKGKE
ncbi:MAG: helix-turn-helix transcriptional regulator [Deltaproteobacteria bacterium]|nr:helix-turn-helix transcriptional regulator [Deltaproteobacteria bacterium]